MSLKLLGKKIFLPLIFVGVGGGAVAMTDKSFDELVGKIGFDVNNKVQVKKIFDQIDTDKSGRISREELKKGFAAAGLKLQEKVLDDIMSVADANHDGGISLEEWEHALKHQHGGKFNPDVGHAVAKGATSRKEEFAQLGSRNPVKIVKGAPEAPSEGKRDT